MSDKTTLLATGLLAIFFFISGLLELLANFIVMTVLFIGFVGIVVQIIMVKSKNKKNLSQ